MKSLFLKNGMPVAAVLLAMAGAFATTSMQSSTKADTLAIRPGYFTDSNGQCTEEEPIDCSNIQKPQLCRLNVTSGPVAYEKDDQNNCVQPRYRIVNGQ